MLDVRQRLPRYSGGQLYFFGVDEHNVPQQGWYCMQRDDVLKILAEYQDELHQQFGVKSLALIGLRRSWRGDGDQRCRFADRV